MLLGIIRGLETLCDVIEYGPVEAAKINTSFCPEAERSYRKIMENIDKPSDESLYYDGDKQPAMLKSESNNNEIDSKELVDDNLDKFGTLVEDIKKIFSSESNNIDLSLIYDYGQLNAYGKVIMDKVSLNRSDSTVDLSVEEQLKMAFRFKERCQQGECDKYSFIFWTLLILIVDGTDIEEHLSLICDFSRFLEINDEEMMNIMKLICVVCRSK